MAKEILGIDALARHFGCSERLIRKKLTELREEKNMSPDMRMVQTPKNYTHKYVFTYAWRNRIGNMIDFGRLSKDPRKKTRASK